MVTQLAVVVLTKRAEMVDVVVVKTTALAAGSFIYYLFIYYLFYILLISFV